MKRITIHPKDLTFDIKVREACRNCKRFGFKATCPPHIPNAYYYKKLITSYSYGKIFYQEFKVNPDKWESEGKKSSLVIHKALQKERENLFSNNHTFISIFGSGSCKLCPECSIPCRHPDKSIVPLEATGIDVVKLMAKYNVKIKFPVKDTFYRVGAIFYD